MREQKHKSDLVYVFGVRSIRPLVYHEYNDDRPDHPDVGRPETRCGEELRPNDRDVTAASIVNADKMARPCEHCFPDGVEIIGEEEGG